MADDIRAQTFSGVAARAIGRDRTAMQVWYSILIPGNPTIPVEDAGYMVRFHGPTFHLLDSHDVGPVLKLGPSVVYERFVAVDRFEDPIDAFDGNRMQSPRKAGLSFEAMTDDRFWELVGPAWGLLSDAGQTAIAKELAAKGEAEVAAFEVAFRLKIAELIVPSDRRMAGGEDSEEYRAAAIIAGGRSLFEAAMRGDAVVLPQKWPLAELAISVPDLARELVGPSPAKFGPVAPLPNREGWQAQTSHHARRLGITDPLIDAWFNVSVQGWWYANRHLLAVPGGHLEVITLASTIDPLRDLDLCASSFAHERNGTLLLSDRPQQVHGGVGPGWIIPFGVRRITDLSEDDYLLQYFS